MFLSNKIYINDVLYNVLSDLFYINYSINLKSEAYLIKKTRKSIVLLDIDFRNLIVR